MQHQLDSLLAHAIDRKASDLHLHVGSPPAIRVSGTIEFLDMPLLSEKDTEGLAREIISEDEWSTLLKEHEIEFSFDFKDLARFRAAIFKSKGHYTLVLRQIPATIFPLEDLDIGTTMVPLLSRKQGLILVTGPTGSGKTSTLISMIDWINRNLNRHILTIEDPIEFYHKPDKGLITHRAVGVDTPGFARGLTDALRGDPDIIMVGELRDLETMEAAVTAAETGHLVFATLHTTGAATTVDRILGSFPHEVREQVRMQLAASLTAVVSQQLCKKKDGTGVIPAYEVMIVDSAIASLIRQAKTHQIPSSIQTGKAAGMVELDEYLFYLANEGVIEADEAIARAKEPSKMRGRLGG